MSGGGAGVPARSRRPVPPPRLTVAIDGPAASGKSTTARGVAERLGYAHLNSGLLYRAIAWAALRGGWVEEGEAFRRGLDGLRLSLHPEPPGARVSVDGEEPGNELVSPAVTARVSEIAARPEARTRVLRLLRAAAAGGGVVCDGRDIGTVVFPDAGLKVFLVAEAEERARRRLLERGEPPTPVAVAAEAARLRERDAADAGRRHSPLRRAPDAVTLDTTRLTREQVVERIVELARERGAPAG